MLVGARGDNHVQGREVHANAGADDGTKCHIQIGKQEIERQRERESKGKKEGEVKRDGEKEGGRSERQRDT